MSETPSQPSPSGGLRPAREFGEQSVNGGIGMQAGGDLTVGGHVVGRDYSVSNVTNIYQSATSGNLPVGSGLPLSRAAKFVDRGKIMDDIRAALKAQTTTAVVGVGGMGGVGKTELARFLAAEVETKAPNTVVWIEVVDRPLAQVHGQMARALGFTLPPNLDAPGRCEMLRAALKASPYWLVVLDDIRRDFAPSLSLCLPPSPPCGALVTSRLHELPGLPADAMRTLNVMTETQALELLRSVPGLFEATAGENEAAKHLCQLCGYHPLALDLAARRLLKRLRDSQTPIAAFNQQLKDRLAQLRYGEGPLESLAANFELSYADLDEADRAHFRKLAVFAPTGFAPMAAAAVWGESEAGAVTVRDALEQLENASLLLPAEQPGRFQLHDLVREYADRKLDGSGEAQAARRLHAEFMIALFESHYTDVRADSGVAHELDNLRVAAEWALDEAKEGQLLARLATVPRNWLYNFFRAWNDWKKWLTSALQLGFEDRGLQANVLQAIGDVQSFREENDAALESYRQALELFRQVGARLGEANVLKAIGDVQQFRDDRDAALASYNDALKLFRAVGAKLGEANVLASLSRLSLQQGDPRTAEQHLKQAVALHESIGSVYSVGVDYGRFADVLLDLGKPAEAKPYALKCKAIFEQIGEPWLIQWIDRILAACE